MQAILARFGRAGTPSCVGGRARHQGVTSGLDHSGPPTPAQAGSFALPDSPPSGEEIGSWWPFASLWGWE